MRRLRKSSATPGSPLHPDSLPICGVSLSAATSDARIERSSSKLSGVPEANEKKLYMREPSPPAKS